MSQFVMYRFIFSYSLDLPYGAVFELVFPSATNEFQNIDKDCEVFSSGFGTSNLPLCSISSSLSIRVTSFDYYTKDEDVIIEIKALNPPISFTSTSEFTINVYYDSDCLYIIGTDDSETFAIIGYTSEPTAKAKIYFPSSSEYISARDTSLSSLNFIFETGTTIPKDSGTIKITVQSGEFIPTSNSILICYFVDPLNDYIKYIAKSCAYASDTFTITAPINIDITSGKRWHVKIYTFGVMSNGLVFPTAGATFISVDLNAAEIFDWKLLVVPTALTIGKVISYCRAVDFLNVYEVVIDTTIDKYSNGYRIEVEFDSNYYDVDLGTGQNDGEDTDCITNLDVEASMTLRCSLEVGSQGIYPYRPLNSRVRIHSQDANGSQIYLSVANVKNPSVEGLNIAVRIKLFDISGGVEVLSNDEMIYFVLGTITSNPVLMNEDSYLYTMAMRQVGAINVDFSVTIDLTDYPLDLNDYIIWKFPYAISESITIEEDSSTNSQNVRGILQKSILDSGMMISNPISPDSFSGMTQFIFDNFDNPEFVPSNFPIMTADIIIDGFYWGAVTYDQSLLNHIPATVTVTHIWAGASANYGYLNGYIDLDILFESNGNINSDFVIEISFPGSFSTDLTCTVLDIIQSQALGD